MDVPLRTAQLWLKHWHAMGVEGVRLVEGTGRGRGGRTYVAAPSLIARWKACKLPVPRAVRSAAA